MHRTWIRFIGWTLLVSLSGCATSKQEVLPHGDATMLDLWEENTSRADGARTHERLQDARGRLRRPLLDERSATSSVDYTRTAYNEITRQFQRLPNPDLVMFVFPHLAGSEQVPVPGYSTVFPLHTRVQYAMPAERTEDY